MILHCEGMQADAKKEKETKRKKRYNLWKEQIDGIGRID